jgi:hypothetical protein
MPSMKSIMESTTVANHDTAFVDTSAVVMMPSIKQTQGLVDSVQNMASDFFKTAPSKVSVITNTVGKDFLNTETAGAHKTAFNKDPEP